MAVTFTSNIALAKPDKTEIAKNWVTGPLLQDDNNVIIVAQTNLPLITYTPVITAATPPNMGTGFSQGEYQDIQGIIFGTFTLEFFDAGIVAGVGEWGVSLPVPADGAFHSVASAINSTPGQFDVIGEGYLYDNSSVGASGSVALDLATVGGISYVRMLVEAYATKTARIYQAGTPFTVATNDKFVGSFIYKKA